MSEIEMEMTTDLPVNKLITRKDARPLDEQALGSMVMSIREIGLINPLRVRPVDGGWEVTAGRHRLEALKANGVERVPCVVVDDDDAHAELVMIDENLCRAELSAAERARHTARKKQLSDIINGIEPTKLDSMEKPAVNGVDEEPENEVGEISDSSPPPEGDEGDAFEDEEKEDFAIEEKGKVPVREESTEDERKFYKETAKQTGRSEQSIKADHKRGQEIPTDVLETIRGTHLDKGTYLDELRKLSPNRQRAKVERDLDEPQEPRKKKVNNIKKVNAIKKLASILLKYVPKEEHDAVEILLEESDHEGLLIAWNKARQKAMS